MATPIAQTVVDEERDRLIVEHPDDIPSVNILFDDFHYRTDMISHANWSNPNTINVARLPGISLSAAKSGGASGSIGGGSASSPNAPRVSAIASLVRATQQQHIAPQSPIMSEWSTWVLAPNRTGGDLLTELEALRKHTTEGLYTTEV